MTHVESSGPRTVSVYRSRRRAFFIRITEAGTEVQTTFSRAGIKHNLIGSFETADLNGSDIDSKVVQLIKKALGSQAEVC